MVAALLVVAACGSADRQGDATGSGKSLGAVPIPAAPAADPVSTADVGHPAILEMGAPVLATLGDGARARVTVLGPVQDTTEPGAASTAGTFTVTVLPVAGQTVVRAADFSSRNEDGQRVDLTSAGPTTAMATAGHAARIRLVGHYSSGAAQVTWKHAGKPLAVWDFNIELD